MEFNEFYTELQNFLDQKKETKKEKRELQRNFNNLLNDYIELYPEEHDSHYDQDKDIIKACTLNFESYFNKGSAIKDLIPLFDYLIDNHLNNYEKYIDSLLKETSKRCKYFSLFSGDMAIHELNKYIESKSKQAGCEKRFLFFKNTFVKYFSRLC